MSTYNELRSASTLYMYPKHILEEKENEPANDKTYHKTCDHRRLRSACASGQSDQNLC